MKTEKAYDREAAKCKSLFVKKLKDYGCAWRVLRLTSFTDQLYIKAQRLRTIQSNGHQKIKDSQEDEFIGLVNYSIMALLQIKLGIVDHPDLKVKQAENYYDEALETTKSLMLQKNHDYGEAWREMRISSLTDLIYQKLLRIKSIEDNQGKTLVSEGIKANFQDIVNYALFALILMKEKETA